MGKSLGITAFVLLLISLPIPVLGNYVSLLALLVLAGAAYAGEKTWVVVVDILGWVKMFLLSPTWHLMMFGGGYMGSVNRGLAQTGAMDQGTASVMQGSTRGMESLNTPTLLITLAICIAPIAILAWRSMQTSAKPAEQIDA